MKIYVEKTANYKLSGVFALTPRSGRFNLLIDDKKMAPSIDLKTPCQFEMLRRFAFKPETKNKTLKLTAGQHTLIIPLPKDNIAAPIGIDFFCLLPAKTNRPDGF